MRHIFFYFLLVWKIGVITCACENHKTCKDCITDPNVCAWCASKDEKYDSEARCKPEGQVEKNWCVGSLDTPARASITAKYENNLDFSSLKDHVVQIKPQLYDVKLRVGQPINFTFSFQEAKDYPVDLYILLDASLTMSDVQNEITENSKTIYETMQRMTKNVFMGFGTFVDKNTPPFSLNVSKEAYSFQNRLNLTEDYKQFQTIVSNIQFGENYDRPEGGFDALAQVIVCDVNWRPKSRRIVVFFSDALQHTTGDGRAGGIFQPFDGKCHTDHSGFYRKELEMDYPSVRMINKLAINNDVTIIFGIKNRVYQKDKEKEEYLDLKKYYERIYKAVRGSKLTLFSSNTLVSKLEETYNEIKSRLKLTVSKSGDFDIKFKPDCYTNSDDDACIVKPDQQTKFNGIITLTKYTGQHNKTIDISIQGIKERLSINVDVIKCSCENDAIEDSIPYCNSQGRQCGVCICKNNKYGPKCMCDAEEGANAEFDALCKTNETMCNGHGNCQCGFCHCLGTYFPSEKFCKCNSKLCPGYKDNEGVVCSGHGACQCTLDAEGRGRETCECEHGWTNREGDGDCSCQLSDDLCVIGGKVCNNRGTCTCNECVCRTPAAWDRRPHYDEWCRMKPCPECHSMQCNSLQKCVQCKLDENCGTECDGIVVTINETLTNEFLNNTEWSVCENQRVNIGCYTKFVYQYDDDNYSILLQMQEKTDCAESYYKYGGILLASLLLCGILTLLAWKCLTRYHDRKEYERFQKRYTESLNNASLNPIYHEPTTTFRNPAFIKTT